MTNYSVTQVLAYHSVDLGHRQHEVATAIRDITARSKKASCESIAEYLGIEKNMVTGRLKELMVKKCIDYDGFTESKYHRQVECYKLAPMGQVSFI